jgi:DNA polymerase elongation subunit (family B)
MNITDILGEIKGFLEGYNNDLKYLVNVETNPNNNYAECVIHEPDKKPEIRKVFYTPFLFCKDLKKNGIDLYSENRTLMEPRQKQYGIKITKLKTGNHKRLVDGYCYKITSTKSYNAILEYFKCGGIDLYEKKRKGKKIVRDDKGNYVYLHRDIFYSPRLTEQFFISTGVRLFKGFEEYKNIHKVVFDIETTGLKYQRSQIFAIGVRNNRGFEIILEAKEKNNKEAEIRLIQDFFNLIIYLQPAIICGYNSEDFDFDFILGRADILGIDKSKLLTALDKRNVSIRRNNRATVKIGPKSIKYTATQMWGFSIIDINHATKRTAAINTELKNTKLKYIAQFEGIARENRTYIEGEDGNISKFYFDNKMFIADENNVYKMIPNAYQEASKKLYKLIINKGKLTEHQYSEYRKKILSENPCYVTWFRENAIPKGMTKLINGKKLLKQYLLEDLWETEQVDELYNQSSFMLAKIIPTTYQRVCTMGTASVWNLLLTAWSYDNNIAIPFSEKKVKFSGGLSRCYKIGFSKRWTKIDYASLYPFIQLTDDVFPMFDITGVIKKMLLYFTTARNIYKKMANKDDINENEQYILSQIDPDSYYKYINDILTDFDRAMFKIKQLPVKILNNSLFGALGAGIAFNWSDNICAARITCTGRLHLRHAISWFRKYGCIPLFAITDGINFQIPFISNIVIGDNDLIEDTILDHEIPIEEAWKFNGKIGVSALIDKFNDQIQRKAKDRGKDSFISVDNDGDFISCLNLSKNNYAIMFNAKNKKTGKIEQKIKLVGNNIKSKGLPEYVDDFFHKGLRLILEDKGAEFVEYYYDYIDLIYYERIPLKKIASKNRVTTTLSQYANRGTNKNGRQKAKQAHMELLIKKRNNTAEALFEEHKAKLLGENNDKEYTIEEKLKIVSDYMPPEPELDSMVYHINIGTLVSHGNSGKDKDENDYSALIDPKDLSENPDMIGRYNVAKYMDNFNKKVNMLLAGFDNEISKQIIAKINTKKVKDITGKMVPNNVLMKNQFINKQLTLTNRDLDSVEESMYLESDEIKFWNRSGYDPRLIWDEFKLTDKEPINYEIYEHALSHLNQKMREAGKKDIKSVNDKHEPNDLLLFKDYLKYYLISYDGTSYNVVKEVTDSIPKSDLELKMEEEKRLLDEKIDNLELLSEENKKKSLDEKYFEKFKEEFSTYFEGGEEEITYKQFIKNHSFDGGKDMLESFITQNMEDDEEEDEPAVYIDIDYDR